jgi:hypothetical protein
VQEHKHGAVIMLLQELACEELERSYPREAR